MPNKLYYDDSGRPYMLYCGVRVLPYDGEDEPEEDCGDSGEEEQFTQEQEDRHNDPRHVHYRNLGRR